MQSYPVNESVTVTLDASGNGTARMIPPGAAEKWTPSNIAVSASSNNSEAACRIYIGPSTDARYYVDGTLSGSTGDSTDRGAGYQIDRHASKLWAVWEGGDPGATGTLAVNGTGELPI